MKVDNLIEGMLAHEYTNLSIRTKIQNEYMQRYSYKTTPLTDPLKFDPLNPPKGWAYDPYYECWFQI